MCGHRQGPIKNLIVGLLLLILCGLTACSSAPPPFTGGEGNALSIQQNLELADRATGNSAIDYKLQAVALLLQQQSLVRADALLRQLRAASLSPPQKIVYELYYARFALLTQQARTALTNLQGLSQDGGSKYLTRLQQFQLQSWLGQAYWQQSQWLPGLLALDQALNILPQNAQLQRQHTLTMVWDQLTKLTVGQMQALLAAARQAASSVINASPADYSQAEAWVKLSLIVSTKLDLEQLQIRLRAWRAAYPHHPANALLPSRIGAAPLAIPQNLHKVAVLLPADGPYSTAASAVRNGILSAYYQAQTQAPQTINLDFINIDGGDVLAAYRQAISQHDQVAIGPLAKNNIITLARDASTTVPTIALNRVALRHPPIWLYQFGLSPEDEVQQIVQRAVMQGYRRALLIAPAGSWGQALAQQLQQSWQLQGGRIEKSIAFASPSALDGQIKRALQVDQSIQRRKQLAAALGAKVRFVPRRRQDLDVVFLIAPPAIARQVQPFLKYYYAGSLPIYATSMLYTGQVSTARDQDLDNIIFCDMPWVLQSTAQLPAGLAAIRRQIRKNWPALYAKQARLFALGVDAYQLLRQLNRLSLLRQEDYFGATGYLSLLPQRKVYRRLLFAQFRRGRPYLLPESR